MVDFDDVVFHLAYMKLGEAIDFDIVVSHISFIKIGEAIFNH